MNGAFKIMLGSMSVWFSGQTFDVLREHFFETLHVEAWIVWGSVSAIAATFAGAGWLALHYCIRIFGRPKACAVCKR